MQNIWRGRIVTNPGVPAGKPLVAGTRISVKLLLDCLAGGWSVSEIMDAYPHITSADVLAALAFSADVLRRKPYITVTQVEESADSENDDDYLRA